MLIVGCMTFVAVLLYCQMKPDQFDLRFIIVDVATGKVSLFKVGQFVALLTSTWALIHETRADQLTDWLFGGYIVAWAGANVANRYVDKQPARKDGE